MTLFIQTLVLISALWLCHKLVSYVEKEMYKNISGD